MKKLFLAVVAIMICSVSFAQNEGKSLEERISNLEKKLNTKGTTWDKINRYVSPSGYIITGYEWNDGGTSTFKINHVNITLAGNLYKGDYGTVDYTFQVAFAGSPKILDAFASYKPVAEFGIKAGQFKSPLGWENSKRSPAALEFVNYSLMSQRLVRMNEQGPGGISASGRDIGVELFGSAFHKDGFDVLSYELALFNGYKINSTDNNKSKDIAGRVIINPVKPFSLFGFFQRGEGAYPVFDPLTQAFIPQDANKYVKLFNIGGGLNYVGDFGFARAEYIHAKTGDLKSQGGYAAAGYHFAKDWTLVGRFDYYDPDTDDSDIHEIDYTGGITYAPLKNLDLKLNYTYKQLTGGFQDKNCIYVQLTLKF